MDKLYIVMPAYNEEVNIEAVVAQWHPVAEKAGPSSRVVVVDDGSKDATYRVLQQLCLKYPQLVALTKKNSGHGSTCLYAYRYAIGQGADYVFQTDSDGQTLPEEFPPFWELREHFDFLIGARKARQDGFSRRMVTKVLKLVVKFIFGENVEDANTPYRLMKAERLNELLQKIPQDFFLANVLISVLAVSENTRVKWIPITFRPRQGGVNSINLKRITKIGLQAIQDFRRIKKEMKRKGED